MKCDSCQHERYQLTNVGPGLWACKDCEWKYSKESSNIQFPHLIETVNFKNYFKNGGNVSKARVEMIKRRRICPDGKGEVILCNKFGKYTDRRARDY